MSSVMIAWVGFQRRADAMKDYWGYDLVHFPNRFASKLLRVLDYFIKIFSTFYILVYKRPSVVWVQVPPSILLHVVFFFKFIFLSRMRVVVDLHNSMLRPFWLKFPFSVQLLNKATVVLAHNDSVFNELLKAGVSRDVVAVLEDKPCSIAKLSVQPTARKFVLIPCSFDVDEPVSVVIEAAKLVPDIDFLVTGKYQNKVRPDLLDSLPENVFFTGYLSKKDFEANLYGASAIVGLTTRDNVQLSVANEALSVVKPMVLSDTTVLRSLYGAAARFVKNYDSKDLAQGIKDVIDQSDLYEAKVSKLLGARNQRWLSQAQVVKEKISV